MSKKCFAIVFFVGGAMISAPPRRRALSVACLRDGQILERRAIVLVEAAHVERRVHLGLQRGQLRAAAEGRCTNGMRTMGDGKKSGGGI